MLEIKEHPQLTERQHEILEMLDRRLQIKVIANELSISESRVNQHIRGLKETFGASDLSQLVARYRQAEFGSPPTPCRNSAYRKSHLPGEDCSGNWSGRVADGELVLADAHSIRLDAPWARSKEPRVVPGVLDGSYAVVRRLAFMLALACGLVAALVLVIMGALTIGELFDGVAEVPVNGTDMAG